VLPMIAVAVYQGCSPSPSPSTLPTFNVEVAAADLAKADSNPAAEEYVPGRMTYEGVTYEIGYRYKGSLGAFFPPCTNVLDGTKEGKCSVKISFIAARRRRPGAVEAAD